MKSGADRGQGLDGGDRGLLMFCTECLRLRLRSRPRGSLPVPPEHTLARLRSRQPLGGGSAVSSSSSSRSATWKSRECTEQGQASHSPTPKGTELRPFPSCSRGFSPRSSQPCTSQSAASKPKDARHCESSQMDPRRSTDVTRRSENYFVVRWALHPRTAL